MRLNLILNKVPQLSETFLVSWINQLVLKGYKVRVVVIGKWYFSLSEKRRMLPNVDYRAKGNIISLATGVINGIQRRNIKLGLKSSLISQGNPGWVHFSYSAIAVQYLEVIPRLQNCGIRFMVSCRGTSDNIKPYISKGRDTLLKSLFAIIDSVHCVSQEMLDRMVSDFELNHSKGFVNRPAIDTANFTPNKVHIQKEKNKYVILSTGRLEYVKGFLFAFLAIQNLVMEGHNIEYRIVGDGKEMEALLFYRNRLGLSSYITLLGSKKPKEVIEEVKVADVYLCSSLSEGISNAVLEAMAVGVPVISTNVGGMGEVVIDGETGVLVSPYDGVAIANGLKKLIMNEDLRIKYASNALEMIGKEFHLDRLGEIFNENYK